MANAIQLWEYERAKNRVIEAALAYHLAMETQAADRVDDAYGELDVAVYLFKAMTT